jgi:serralysin
MTTGSGDVPYYVSALLTADAGHWGPGGTMVDGARVGQAVTVTFGFLADPAGLYPTDASGFAPLTEAQKQAARQALSTWSAVAGVAFAETEDPAAASIRFASNRQGGASAAYAYYPGPAPGGGVFLANDTPTNTAPAPGTYGFLTLVHEIGHTLGLKHPGNYDTRSNATPGPFLPPGEDNRAYSVMSYNQGAVPRSNWPAGPSIDDIAAVQYLYGANMAAAPGDDAYALQAGGYRAVWDPSGVNTLDAGAQTAPVFLDLRPGGISTVNGLASIGVAFGTRVQRAQGGAGDDTLVPNGLGDALDGGGGHNVAVFGQGRGAYAVTHMDSLAGTYVVSGPDGNSVLSNVQEAHFADGSTIPLTIDATGSFGALRYLSSNPDLALAYGQNTAAASLHYATHGVFEGRTLSGFDPYRYLDGYPDLLAAFGPDPYAAEMHYVGHGVREGRDPAAFDPARYLAANPDLATAFGNDLQAAEIHYARHGFAEGRPLSLLAALQPGAADPITAEAVPVAADPWRADGGGAAAAADQTAAAVFLTGIALAGSPGLSDLRWNSGILATALLADGHT